MNRSLKTSFNFFIIFVLIFYFSKKELFGQKSLKRSTQKEIILTLSFPKIENLVSTLCIDSIPDITVTIKNKTDTIASFYEDWNSWGFYNMNFEISTTDSIYELIHLKGGWDKNYPSYFILSPGDSIILKYNILGSNCDSWEFFARMPKQSLERAKIRAIYQLWDLEGHLFMTTNDPNWYNRGNKKKSKRKKKTSSEIIRSFVTSKLVSQYYKIRYEATESKN